MEVIKYTREYQVGDAIWGELEVKGVSYIATENSNYLMPANKYKLGIWPKMNHKIFKGPRVEILIPGHYGVLIHTALDYRGSKGCLVVVDYIISKTDKKKDQIVRAPQYSEKINAYFVKGIKNKCIYYIEYIDRRKRLDSDKEEDMKILKKWLEDITNKNKNQTNTQNSNTVQSTAVNASGQSENMSTSSSAPDSPSKGSPKTQDAKKTHDSRLNDNKKVNRQNQTQDNNASMTLKIFNPSSYDDIKKHLIWDPEQNRYVYDPDEYEDNKDIGEVAKMDEDNSPSASSESLIKSISNETAEVGATAGANITIEPTPAEDHGETTENQSDQQDADIPNTTSKSLPGNNTPYDGRSDINNESTSVWGDRPPDGSVNVDQTSDIKPSTPLNDSSWSSHSTGNGIADDSRLDLKNELIPAIGDPMSDNVEVDQDSASNSGDFIDPPCLTNNNVTDNDILDIDNKPASASGDGKTDGVEVEHNEDIKTLENSCDLSISSNAIENCKNESRASNSKIDVMSTSVSSKLNDIYNEDEGQDDQSKRNSSSNTSYESSNAPPLSDGITNTNPRMDTGGNEFIDDTADQIQVYGDQANKIGPLPFEYRSYAPLQAQGD
ncbi:hypothetical protein AGMMS49921_02100 [Endomicrobiia bacterium]|nr:hypothetical protein AGMMS49921_02100 [Endomicrobiia bacterium]